MILVPTRTLGVPRFGVINVGLLSTTNFVPVPVWLAMLVALPTEVITPVKLAFVVTLPAVKPAAVPVIFVPTRVDGVPRFGVTSVGELLNTTETVPVLLDTPVPPLETFSIPANVIPPEVGVLGVNPVAPALNVATPAPLIIAPQP